MSESTLRDPVSVVLSLDDNQAVSVDMQPNSSGDVDEGEGGASRVAVDSNVPIYKCDGDVPARKRVRFEE